MTLVLVLLAAAAAVALLAMVVAAGDRFSALLAERHAADYLSAPLGQAVRVRVHGSPFLTQAINGCYRNVEVTSAGLRIGALGNVTLRAHLVNARLPLRDLLGRRVQQLPVDHVTGELVIPYPELARETHLPGLRLRFRDNRLIATAAVPVPVPGIGQLARISGEAVTTIDESGAVWLRVRNVSVAGIGVPVPVLSALVPTLSFPIPLPPLPYALRLERLTPIPDGLQVSGSADNAVFRASIGTAR